MAQLDKRATELGEVVREIVKRFEMANVAACNGPHADLTMQESRVVEFIGESDGQMMRAVADYLGIAVNSVTTLADNLERKGLLRRVRSKADRRVVHVELTEAGRQAYRSIAEVKQHFHREMLAALTDEEQAILLVLLRKIGGVSGGAPSDAVNGSHGSAAEPRPRATNGARQRTSNAHPSVRGSRRKAASK